AIGVEKIWPVQSPNILKVTVVKAGNTRRAKLYYLRKRIGKTALKVK
ncbi:50S ribosomal protein L19, partial [Microgenomates group bacterium]|nr:50S ribosomal protein L19 [Microgenomates group bacterium]